MLLLLAAGKGNRQHKAAAGKFYGLLEIFFCTSRFSL